MLRLITALVVALFALGTLASNLHAQANKEPAKIIARGTDWRFFNELKKELKG